jgi:hypothetical protein
MRTERRPFVSQERGTQLGRAMAMAGDEVDAEAMLEALLEEG